MTIINQIGLWCRITTIRQKRV